MNPRTSGMESRFGPEFIRFVPTRRYSMFSLINNTPGVSPTSPASGAINTVSVFGSAVNENAFLIDGTNFTCPCQGVSRAEPIMDVIQELHVQSIGASVEFGNLQGGVFNVVTKQGGARFAAETSYYAQTSSLTAQPIVLPVRAGTQPTSRYERVRYRDLTTSVGGPVKRDRLWFFSAYQYLRDYDSQPGADPAFPRRYEQNKIFGKLNWQLTPSLQMMQSFHQEKWVNPSLATLAAPFVTTQRVHASVPNMTFAHLTHVLSNRTVWEARVGRFLLRQDADPSSGDRTTPFRTDQITGISSGNASQITTLHLDRATAKMVLHRYQPGWLGTDHEFKVGAQIERGEHRLLQILAGGVRYVDSNGSPFQAVFREPSIAGGVFVTPAAFASDRFKVGERITVDAGIRFDHSRAINPDLPVVSAGGRETDAVTAGVGTVYTQDVVSPRLGLTASFDRSGRTLLRASYGRFNQGVLTGELDPISQGTTPTTTMAYETATGGYTRLISVVDPKLNLALDPDTRTPHTDEFSVALDREITPRVRASVAYIRKHGRDFIGWLDRAGQYREETRLIGGSTLPVFVLTNATSDRRFFLTNPDSLFVTYDGLVVVMEMRRSNGWQASGSYTYSRTHGLQVMSNGTADDPQFSTIARAGFLTFGQDPNDLTNAAGRLPNDRPHVFRATSIVRLPWKGVQLAANLQTFSGKPWAATTQVSLPQGSRKVLLEPRGTRRLSWQSLLDLRVSKTLSFGAAGSVDMILDVLNLLGDSAAEALVSDNFASETFGRPRLFIDPRRAMLGVRLNLVR
jgi:TonB dependent receptor